VVRGLREHHEAFGFTQPVAIVVADDRAFQHGLVLQQAVFNLSGATKTPLTFNMSSVRP